MRGRLCVRIVGLSKKSVLEVPSGKTLYQCDNALYQEIIEQFGAMSIANSMGLVTFELRRGYATLNLAAAVGNAFHVEQQNEIEKVFLCHAGVVILKRPNAFLVSLRVNIMICRPQP